jgi:hypothetical protein
MESHAGVAYTLLGGRQINVGASGGGVATGAGIRTTESWIVIDLDRQPASPEPLCPDGATMTVAPDGYRFYSDVDWRRGATVLRKCVDEADVNARLFSAELVVGRARGDKRFSARFAGFEPRNPDEERFAMYCSLCTTLQPWIAAGRCALSELDVSATALMMTAARYFVSEDPTSARVVVTSAPGLVRCRADALLKARGIELGLTYIAPEALGRSESLDDLLAGLDGLGIKASLRADDRPKACPVGARFLAQSPQSRRILLEMIGMPQLHALGGARGLANMRQFTELGDRLPASDGQSQEKVLLLIREDWPPSVLAVVAAAFTGCGVTSFDAKDSNPEYGLFAPSDVWAAERFVRGERGPDAAPKGNPGRPSGLGPASGGRRPNRKELPDEGSLTPVAPLPVIASDVMSRVLDALHAGLPTKAEFDSVREARHRRKRANGRLKPVRRSDAHQPRAGKVVEWPRQVRPMRDVCRPRSDNRRSLGPGKPTREHAEGFRLSQAVGGVGVARLFEAAADVTNSVADIVKGGEAFMRTGGCGPLVGYATGAAQAPIVSGKPGNHLTSSGQSRGPLQAHMARAPMLVRTSFDYASWAARVASDPWGLDWRFKATHDGVMVSAARAPEASLFTRETHQLMCSALGALAAADFAARQGRIATAEAMLLYLPLPMQIGGANERKRVAVESHLRLLRGERGEIVEIQRWLSRGIFLGSPTLSDPPVRVGLLPALLPSEVQLREDSLTVANGWLREAARDTVERIAGCVECGKPIGTLHEALCDKHAAAALNPYKSGGGTLCAARVEGGMHSAVSSYLREKGLPGLPPNGPEAATGAPDEARAEDPGGGDE